MKGGSWKEASISINNIVASARLGGSIDLKKSLKLGITKNPVPAKRDRSSSPEAEKSFGHWQNFPGLFYFSDEPKCVLGATSSGLLHCVGTKKESETYAAIVNFEQVLESNGLIKYNHRN